MEFSATSVPETRCWQLEFLSPPCWKINTEKWSIFLPPFWKMEFFMPCCEEKRGYYSVLTNGFFLHCPAGKSIRSADHPAEP
jgi:hypothetical protein